MHVVVAPDKFKGSLTAVQVAARIAAGLRAVIGDLEVMEVPMADGGDGTVDAAVAAGFGRKPVRCGGPTGAIVETSYARRHDSAVIEMASACGLSLLAGGRLEPMAASSLGLGEVMTAALDAGCRKLVVGIGGSASTDGGAGFLQALGVQICDARGELFPAGKVRLSEVRSLSLSDCHPALQQASVVIACDVNNPLYGPNGAAAVYGPQKGADAAQVQELDRGLRHWAAVVAAATQRDCSDSPGAGAAGGVGFAALAVLGATLRPGIDLVLDLCDFHTKLRNCRLVITGEGSLDEQTLSGKTPAGVAAAARTAGVPTIAIAGRNGLDGKALEAAGIERVYALTDLQPDLARSIAEAGVLVEQAAGELARDYLLQK